MDGWSRLDGWMDGWSRLDLCLKSGYTSYRGDLPSYPYVLDTLTIYPLMHVNENIIIRLNCVLLKQFATQSSSKAYFCR